MSQIRVAVIVGSLRQDSLNKKLALALAKLAPSDFLFEHVRIDDLPQYNQDDDAKPSEQVRRLKTHLSGTQALLFVTPEYNRSIPGVLKNAIDHASRPYGQSVWGGKPAAVIGASIGATGTAAAQQHLRNVLAYLDVPVMGQPEGFIHAKEGLFTPEGGFGEASHQFMQSWVDKYVAWVRAHIPMRDQVGSAHA